MCKLYCAAVVVAVGWVGDKGSPLPDFPHFLIGDEEQVELALAHSSNLLMWKIIVCIIDIKVMVNLLI